jgi:hypothetical protein
MKTRNVLTLLSLIFCAGHLFATDRVVQQAGPVGTYASIGAAITAAVDGDNIIINNRTDGLPWLENLSITKSLTFVSAVDNIQWWMEGTINIAMAEGRTVTVVGLRNTSSGGNITKSGTVPVNRTAVNILNSDIAGDITMGSGINFYLGSSKAGAIVFTFGKLIGNDLQMVNCNPDPVVTEDVNMVIGNRIGYWTNPSNSAYNHTNNTQYLFFSNNYVRGVTSQGSQITALKNGSTINRVVNCVFTGSHATSYGPAVSALYISLSSATQLSIENSSFGGLYSSTYGAGSSGISIVSGSSYVTCTYNMYYNPSQLTGGTALSTSLGNFAVSASVAGSANINANGGFISGLSHVDAGNPSNSALDLDLSRNDIGVYGGSYSMANFLPLMNNVESSRVNYMNTPRIVNQGGTVNVQVIGYDK